MHSRLVSLLRTVVLAFVLAIVLAVRGSPTTSVARADCPPINTWLGPPDINRFADGNCGYYVNGLSLPMTQNNVTISTLNLSGTVLQEDNVAIGTGALLTTAAGTQWSDTPCATCTGLITATGGDIEIGAGTTIQISGGTSTISAYGGTLNFNGTASQPVTLTSANASPAPGDWGRVEYDAGTSGSMSFTNLSFAGAPVLENGCGSCVYSTGILISGGNPPVSDVTVSNSAGNGIEYLPTTNNVAALTLTNNAGFAAYFDSANADLSNFVITASGNGHNDVGINGGTATGTWNNAGVPIFPQGDVLSNNLSVGPGVTILLNGGHSFSDMGGTLNFNGTASQPITLTSANASPAPGDWGRVEYDSGSSGAMTFTNVTFAGTPRPPNGAGCCNMSDGILNEGGSLSLAGVTVTSSQGNGVEQQSGALGVAGASFTGNAGTAVRYDVMSDLSSVSGLTASGNGQNALSMQSGSTSASLTWPSVGIPIAITGGDVDVSGGIFTIQPGTTVQLNNGENLIVSGGASLSALGTSSRQITITSANSTPKAGDWGSVQITGGATGTLSFATLDFGGSGGAPELLVSGASPTVENDVFENSAGHDVDVANGTPSLKYNWLLAVPSGFDGVVNGGSASVNAAQNFWGSATGPTTSGNPGGKGTPVCPNVTFSPFLGTTVKPTSGLPGSKATVTGTGYNPGESITIRWGCSAQACASNTTVLAKVKASSTGTFRTSVTIPSNAKANKSCSENPE